MNEPILVYVLGQLERCKGRLPRVAEGSGVPYRTLQKIVSGETRDPRVGVVQKLVDYFRSHHAQVDWVDSNTAPQGKPDAETAQTPGIAHQQPLPDVEAAGQGAA